MAEQTNTRLRQARPIAAAWIAAILAGALGPPAASGAMSPITSIPLKPGFNAIGYPIGGSGELSTFELLPLLGGPVEIERILFFDTLGGTFRSAGYDGGGQITGDDVPVRFGDGLIVIARSEVTVTVSEAAPCRPLDLVPGFNLKTLPCAAPGLSAFGLLRALGGDGRVASIERFDPVRGLFDFATMSGGQPVGDDFPVAPGDALLVSMRSSASGWDAQLVGPAGGVLEFSNGVVLDVPPGAVADQVALGTEDLDCAIVDPIVTAPFLSSLDKRCLGGFIAEPDGLQFAVPIRASVPVPELLADEIPLWALPDTAAGTYTFAQTDIFSLGAEDRVEAEITHFSAHAAVGGRSKIEVTGDPLPAECSIVPTPPNSCCTTFKVEVRAGDMQTGAQCDECQIVGEQIDINFFNCPGSPAQRIEASETSGDCPDDLRATINPAPAKLWTCQTQRLEAILEGTNRSGGQCTFSLAVNWTDDTGGALNRRDEPPSAVRVRATDPVTATITAKSLADSDLDTSTVIDFVSLGGTWQQNLLSGSETCTLGGEVSVEDEGPDQFNLAMTHQCTDTTNRLEVRSVDLPATDPFVGDLVETGNPARPFVFTDLGVVGSSNTPDCFVFFASNARDIVFGDDPVCPPDGNECEPVSCTESEQSDGGVNAATAGTLDGSITFQFDASWDELVPDPDTGQVNRERRSISCSDNGDVTFSATKL